MAKPPTLLESKIDKSFITERQGRSFVLFAGLLDLAHQDGLSEITVTLLQAPTKENGMLAISQARVVTSKGTFTEIGDASPENVGKMIAAHITRMSATRAKARALRDACNIGATALEELGDLDHDDQPRRAAPAPAAAPKAAAPSGARARPQVVPPPAPEEDVPLGGEEDDGETGAVATPKQLENIAKAWATLKKSGNPPQPRTEKQAGDILAELTAEYRKTPEYAARMAAKAAAAS